MRLASRGESMVDLALNVLSSDRPSRLYLQSSEGGAGDLRLAGVAKVEAGKSYMR
jgi:hypothetical protein